jgi:hypothetical protein
MAAYAALPARAQQILSYATARPGEPITTAEILRELDITLSMFRTALKALNAYSGTHATAVQTWTGHGKASHWVIGVATQAADGRKTLLLPAGPRRDVQALRAEIQMMGEWVKAGNPLPVFA